MKKVTEAEIRRRLARSLIAGRNKRSWTQKELAERSQLPRSYVADLEGARRNPSMSTLLRLANALEIPLGELFNGAE